MNFPLNLARSFFFSDINEDDLEAEWKAIDELPLEQRLHTGLIEVPNEAGGYMYISRRKFQVTDMRTLEKSERQKIVEKAFVTSDQDNERLLLHCKQRIDRMMLVLGPPGSGKSTLLKALAGKHDKGLKQLGSITYNGHDMSEFIPQRTSAYVSQNDNHMGELTVRETLDFAARCMGTGYNLELLKELVAKEMQLGLRPDPEIDAFMKGTAIEGAPSSLSTDYMLKILGLDICADTLVGNVMIRGISGGQKKRVTTGEMVIGPKRIMFMDEISTGLDSATTFQIVNRLRNITHLTEATVMIVLLQPAPETYELFDDVLLLAEGLVVYLGPRSGILNFFEKLGFKLPPRKGIADFLQEVTSRKDQGQYWADSEKPYVYVSVEEMAAAFKASSTGQELAAYMEYPFDKMASHPAALVRQKYALTGWQLIKACTDRELILIKRHMSLYIFRTCQVGFVGFVTSTLFLRTRLHQTDEHYGNLYLSTLFFALIHMMFNGFSEMTMTVLRLPILYKQRDNYFFPTWAFSFPSWVLRLPYSLAEAVIWSGMVYYVVGLAPSADRFFRYMFILFLMHQMALALFRLIGALARTMVVANTFGSFALLVVLLLGGFILSKDSIHDYWVWGYWISPLSYAQNAIAVNEFLDMRWNKPSLENNSTVALNVLRARGLKTKGFWFWVGVAVLTSYTVLFNFLVTFAIDYLNPLGQKQSTGRVESMSNTSDLHETATGVAKGSRSENNGVKKIPSNLVQSEDSATGIMGYLTRIFSTITRQEDVDPENVTIQEQATVGAKKGMTIPFRPLSLTFRNVNYYVDMPSHIKEKGPGERLHLLQKVSGAFRPGVLTALVGVSGAGKTTLMDVLAGRKTGGYIDGDIRVSGFKKRQETFARICGYVEQTDIHSPQVTVYETLIYSSWLRLPDTIQESKRLEFVEEVMDLVELASLKGALVGLPGSTGLSTEQRKRLTIAVELVANPSIIFMDEPTSGLDARAAAIVMRTVRNTVDTGRTVVCTIHQPSIDIFEAFDELLLMKRGGQVIYSGSLGKKSELLIRKNDALILECNRVTRDAKDLHFSTQYSRNVYTQVKACLWKQHLTYWRSPHYNAVRFFFTIIVALIFGTVFYGVGAKRNSQSAIFNVMGALYAAVLFMGVNNASSVQPVVSVERAVFYRERAAGMYGPLPYASAQAAIEIPYIFVQTMIYGVITYAMIQFEWTAAKFLWYLLFMFMTLTYFTLYGMMAVGLTPSEIVAAVVSSAFYSLWNLFSGFLIPRPSMPGWWVWFYWISPVAWTLNGLISSQLGDVELGMDAPGYGRIRVKDFLEAYFGFKHSMLGVCAVVLLSFIVLFWFIFACSIKFLNFQNR
ncbi:hypothetical protein R1flu_010190 [Riccia fluitans]|uniref:ABC transporter domain-containing protein n=1 Tax=Riccia fluitans TaxID=41844 RepID=A0ABD1Z562_9MARC